jgi:hypothetical protein
VVTGAPLIVGAVDDAIAAGFDTMVVEPQADTRPATTSAVHVARAVREINPDNGRSAADQMLNSHLR